MSYKKRSQKLSVGRNMPPSLHKIPGENYDVKKSEAVQWLIQRPSILEFIWDQFKQSGDLEFDAETGQWIGIDYESEVDE